MNMANDSELKLQQLEEELSEASKMQTDKLNALEEEVWSCCYFNLTRPPASIYMQSMEIY